MFGRRKKSREKSSEEKKLFADYLAYTCKEDRFLRNVASNYDLSVDLFKILIFISNNPNGVQRTDIQNFYGFQRSNLSRFVDSLTSKGLVVVKNANEYGQYGTIHLTAKAEKLLDGVCEFAHTQEDDVKPFADFIELSELHEEENR